MMIKLPGKSSNFFKKANFLEQLAISQIESFLESILTETK